MEEELKDILDWLKEFNPVAEESFYQNDTLMMNLPELGIIVFNVMQELNLWKPTDYSE